LYRLAQGLWSECWGIAAAAADPAGNARAARPAVQQGLAHSCHCKTETLPNSHAVLKPARTATANASVTTASYAAAETLGT